MGANSSSSSGKHCDHDIIDPYDEERLCEDFSEIVPGKLYLSSVYVPTHKTFLVQQQVTDVVSLRSAFMGPARGVVEAKGSIRNLHFAVEDSVTSEMMDIFRKSYDFIEDSISITTNNDDDDGGDQRKNKEERRNKCLVHCEAGMSRSAAVIIAYLMKKNNMKTKEAFYYVKERRAIISPNSSFLKQLLQYESELFPDSPKNIAENDFLAEYVINTRLQGCATIGITFDMVKLALIETNADIAEAQLKLIKMSKTANPTVEQ